MQTTIIDIPGSYPVPCPKCGSPPFAAYLFVRCSNPKCEFYHAILTIREWEDLPRAIRPPWLPEKKS